MSRKRNSGKVADHVHMDTLSAGEGYARVLREMFSSETGPARLRAYGPEIMKMRACLEALAMSEDGKAMESRKALFVLMQTVTWLVESMVSKLVDDCGHEQCAKARMAGLSHAIGLVVGELLTEGRKAPNLKEGVEH